MGTVRRNEKKRKTRILSLCAVLAALGVVLMYVGSFVEILDFCLSLAASFGVILLVIELGGSYPWLVYAVTSVLSLLCIPNRTPAIVYAGFMGFYPILKEKLEKRLRGPVGLLPKLAVFLASLALMWGAAQLILGGLELGVVWYVLLPLLILLFLFYDYALSVLITAYLRVWRKRLRVEKFFTPD